jgi:hypothetical protein
MKRLLTCVLAFACFSGLSYGGTAAPQSFWSKTADILGKQQDGKYRAIHSPDGEIAFAFNGEGFSFKNKQGRTLGVLNGAISTPDLLELGWSSDSMGVFINASDGGALGTWHTYVWQRSKSGLHEIAIENLVARTSALRTDCQYKNVGSVAWVEGHRRLLVVEQVPDTSRCSHMGEMVGYVVDVRKAEVVERLSSKQVKTEFYRQLGPQAVAATE